MPSSALHRLARRVFAASLLITGALGTSAWSAASIPVRIGILQSGDEAMALSQWTATANYLSKKNPPYRFSIVLLNLVDLQHAVDASAIDFVFTDAGNFVELEDLYGISALATVKRIRNHRASAFFSTAIFTRSSRHDIQALTDLKGKVFVAGGFDAFSNFQTTWLELIHQGIDPFRDFARVKVGGLSCEQAVFAVRDGEADAGAACAGTLERLATAKTINLSDFRVLNVQTYDGFAPLHSTRLYPEWALATLRHTDPDLAQHVAIDLLTMSQRQPAARAAHIAGWTVAADYQPVREVLKALRLGPYKDFGRVSARYLVRQYRYAVLGSFLGFTLVIGAIVYMFYLNRRLKQSTASLKTEFVERHRAENELLGSEDALRSLHEITAAQDLDFDRKVAALLAMGCEKFGLPVGILSHVQAEDYEVEFVVGSDGRIVPGGHYRVGDTYCSVTLKSAEPVGFEHAATSEWKTHPAYGKTKLEAYLGMIVVVEGAIYGTINFSSMQWRDALFTATDREIIKLMAQWVGGEIQRKRANEEKDLHLARLAHVARLSTMGEMATGIAHELNQPLAAIANYSHGCIRRLQGANASKEVLEAMTEVAAQAERAGGIIRRVRRFVSTAAVDRRLIDINEVIGETVKLIWLEVQQQGITITVDAAKSISLVSADVIQIQQVILNLLRNGIEAMTDGEPAQRRIAIKTSQPTPDAVEVAVTDTGLGFSDEMAERIFDPFFTTKSQGMGMGLSICRSIIEAHGGKLWAAVNYCSGATFRFVLPVEQQSTQLVPQAEARRI